MMLREVLPSVRSEVASRSDNRSIPGSQIFWEIISLIRGPLSLVSTIEELPGWENSGSGLEHQDYDRRDQSCSSCGAYPQKL
jgi:hypothetical protein